VSTEQKSYGEIVQDSVSGLAAAWLTARDANLASRAVLLEFIGRVREKAEGCEHCGVGNVCLRCTANAFNDLASEIEKEGK
jgi:hypothetical protein